MPDRACPLCGLVDPNSRFAPRANSPLFDFRCQRCGVFAFFPNLPTINILGNIPRFLEEKFGIALGIDEATRHLSTYLSIYTRECFETGRPAEPLDLANPSTLVPLAEAYAFTPIFQKAEKLLRLVERRTRFPGEGVRVVAHYDYPAIHAINVEEFLYHYRMLLGDHLIEGAFAQAGTAGLLVGNLKILPEGWRKLSAAGSRSRIGFVAMSFAAELETPYQQGLALGIKDAGYEPVRIDLLEHNEKICDRVIAEIRRSRFVVADVTSQRQNVYFEAGFAMGMGIPVIWCCREDDLPKVHFDTRQYNHIVWNEPANLRARLRDRIVATIGVSLGSRL